MITLINTNRMMPPVAPIGLDYLAGSLRAEGIAVDLLDLGLAEQPGAALEDYFSRHSPQLVGLTVRNVDASFWPSTRCFVQPTAELVQSVRRLTDAPIVLGGCGFSIFARQLVQRTGADYGIRGDGEAALGRLYHRLTGRHRGRPVGGLIQPDGPEQPTGAGWEQSLLNLPVQRDVVDNRTYLQRGGQVGVETKRGCPVGCCFCADVLAKGRLSRLRPADQVADEMACLLDQQVDVFHLCDSEFNLPIDHARAVCQVLIDRGLGRRVRWYTYLSAVPFDGDLARSMRRAGCVGVNFTAPAASPTMLRAYRQHHRVEDLVRSICQAHAAGLTVMVDLMLGGPGESPRTVRHAIDRLRATPADCIGVALGVRLYPDLPLTRRIADTEGLENNPALYPPRQGPPDLLMPTYYLSPRLGPQPARLVRQIIAGDQRFFAPTDPPDPSSSPSDPDARTFNYEDNTPLVRAIADGARGAYWDILRQLH